MTEAERRQANAEAVEFVNWLLWDAIPKCDPVDQDAVLKHAIIDFNLRQRQKYGPEYDRAGGILRPGALSLIPDLDDFLDDSPARYIQQVEINRRRYQEARRRWHN